MSSFLFLPLLVAAVLACLNLPANAVAGADSYSAGATGAQARQTDVTWQDVDQTPAPGNYDPGVGNTSATGSQGAYDPNGAQIPPTVTPLEAPNSGMAGPIPSGQFTYGFPNTGSDVYRGPYQGSSNNGGTLPPTATSSVDINMVDFHPLPMGGSDGSGGDFPGADGGGDIPPAPGPGFQPIMQHGVFVGWYTPDEVALAQTNFPAALLEAVNGPYYYGGDDGRNSILYELGVISSPFGGS